MVASRLRIAWQTTVKAARSAAASFESACDSPRLRNFGGVSVRRVGEELQLLIVESVSSVEFGGIGVPAGEPQEGLVDLVVQIRRGFATDEAAKPRAASTNCTSFSSTSACSGVFVRPRATVQTSRVGASKASMFGSGAVRFHTE